MDPATHNGGFPLPPDSEPYRIVTARHEACAGETRVRLPGNIPPRAVRRVVCDRCAQSFDAAGVEDFGITLPPLPDAPVPLATAPQPESGARSAAAAAARLQTWRWLSLPVAAVAVVVAMNAVQGSDSAFPPVPEQSASPAEAVRSPDRAATREARGQRAQRDTGAAAQSGQLISESTFQLALPPGWERTTPAGGATFTAVAPGAEADATLWVERDPKLNFARFEARSLEQLQSIAGSAGVIERKLGPTPETSSIKIAPTDVPEGAPIYEGLLRASGDRWYYLATTIQPDASAAALEGVRLIQGSFLPTGVGG